MLGKPTKHLFKTTFKSGMVVSGINPALRPTSTSLVAQMSLLATTPSTRSSLTKQSFASYTHTRGFAIPSNIKIGYNPTYTPEQAADWLKEMKEFLSVSVEGGKLTIYKACWNEKDQITGYPPENTFSVTKESREGNNFIIDWAKNDDGTLTKNATEMLQTIARQKDRQKEKDEHLDMKTILTNARFMEGKQRAF